MSGERYKELEEKYEGARGEITSINDELVKWKGGTFPRDYILIRGQQINILGDLPVKLWTLSLTRDGKLDHTDLESSVLGASWAMFNAGTVTPFMYKDAIYTMKVEPIEFDRIRLIIDRKQ